MRKKLLLADDSITIQKVIGITFANEDYELSIVDNGDAALAKARSELPDLILADVFMPGKNGYELCSAVRQEPALRDVPVLLLTGTFEPFDENKARAAGADSWIAKPFESQALIDRVEELLARVPQPAAVPAPASAAAPTPDVAPAAAPADAWGELEEEAVPPPAAMENAEAAATGESMMEEDIWGDVSFAEEDLALGEEAEVPVEDIWGSFEEEAPAVPAAAVEKPFAFTEPEEEFVFTEEEAAPSAAAEEPLAFEDFEAMEEEILPLDELDILEEEELAEQPAAEESVFAEEEPVATAASGEGFVFDEEESVAAFAAEEEFVFGDEDEPAAAPAELPALEDELATAVAPVAFEEEFSLTEEGPEWGIAEETAAIEPAAASFEEVLISPAEALMEVAAPASAVAVEERVAALSEEQLTQIVERVAGAVIERLAGSVLEKIAWEVVPDLAEGLVKEEIRKIRQDAQ